MIGQSPLGQSVHPPRQQHRAAEVEEDNVATLETRRTEQRQRMQQIARPEIATEGGRETYSCESRVHHEGAIRIRPTTANTSDQESDQRRDSNNSDVAGELA